MKVGFNTFPLQSGHRRRGIGYYTKHLLDKLKEDESIDIEEFTEISQLKSVDVIHYPWFDFFFHTLPIRKKFPTIVTVHDVIPLIFSNHHPVGIRGKVNFYLQKMALKNCKYIITDSNTSKKDIIREMQTTEEKITPIPLAIDENFKILKDPELLRVRRKYNLPDTFLLYVGDANYTKNLPFLIKAFHKLINFPEFTAIKLVLVGSVFLKNVEDINHAEIESLKEVNRLVKEFKIEDSIIRPGILADEELVGFYNLATIYIQPSLYEGFGLPILQAFACGTPVISSNTGSLKEVGGDAAIYFDPKSIDQFLLIMREVLQNRSLRIKLTKLGFKQESKFTWKKVVSETKKVYFDSIRKSNDQ